MDRRLFWAVAALWAGFVPTACLQDTPIGGARDRGPAGEQGHPAGSRRGDLVLSATEPLAAFSLQTAEPPGIARIGPGGATLADPPGTPIGSLRAGVVVPFEQKHDGWAKIISPCERPAWIPESSAEALRRPFVMLDPGHGGREVGAVGPSGLTEAELNFDIAEKTAAELQSHGIPAVLTRSGDYRATVRFRVELARAARPDVLVSIHHNSSPEGALSRPGTETFYQFRSQSSKRLAGLVYEEAFGGLAPLAARWVGNSDAGAKWRLNADGEDFYGILRRSHEAGVTSALAEFSFLSNPDEESLLRQEQVRRIEAQSLARAIVRYLKTQDPGSGFTVPHPRAPVGGPGGGAAGCVDPA